MTAAVMAQEHGAPAPLGRPPAAIVQSTPAANQLSDKTFIDSAAQAFATQIELSKLAEHDASDSKTREYGSWILKDYEAAAAQLNQTAAKVRVDVPAAIDEQHAKLIGSINRNADETFDSRYLKLMKEQHDSLTALFDRAHSDSTLSVELREYADKILPTLRQYQKRAQTLLESMNSA
ncbi:MAG TPA: DUF4142 domain-containing protein [Spongiibacteraceae bacterium]